MAYFQGKLGDWRLMFTQLDKIDAVTTADVQRVAEEIFTPNNRTVVYIETVSD